MFDLSFLRNFVVRGFIWTDNQHPYTVFIRCEWFVIDAMMSEMRPHMPEGITVDVKPMTLRHHQVVIGLHHYNEDLYVESAED